MKKIISILILMMIVLSIVPMAFANNDDAGPRTIIKERLEQARANYQIAKERYQNARERYQNAKQNIDDIRAKVQACKNDDSSDCSQIRRQVKSNSKDFLSSSADKILEVLEKIKSKVESSEDLSEEDAQEILDDIDAKIAEVEDAKSVIENLNNESSSEDIKAAVQTIRDAWKDTRLTMKWSVGRLLNGRISTILANSERLGEKLQDMITKLEEKGYDATDLNGLMDDYNANIEEAKNNYDLAKEKYQEAKTVQDYDEVLREANDYIKQAHERLKLAHKTVKEIVQQIREKAGSLEEAEAGTDSEDNINEGEQ